MVKHLEIEIVPTGPYLVNCGIVWGPEKTALVIDPGFSENLLAHKLEERGLNVTAYLLTHGHADHLNALAALHRRFPAPVLMHPLDSVWAFETWNQIPGNYGVPERPGTPVTPLEDGVVHSFGGLTFHVLHTPGHSPGCVCFYFPEDKVLFSGDTLFQGSVGRTDLPGSDARQQTESLKKLAALPGETVVWPGHGPATDIATEKQTNFFLQRLKP